MSFTNLNRTSATYSNTNKSVSPFVLYLRHGKEPLMEELADYTFTSVVFQDGTILENVTFEQLSNTTWANITKS